YDDVEAEEDGKLSAVSIVVLALVGIILGAIVFKGFEVLWGRFDRILVSILALVVSGAMVGVVHALRTARDSVSMTLAGVVGLVLTFGPLLIIILYKLTLSALKSRLLRHRGGRLCQYLARWKA